MKIENFEYLSQRLKNRGWDELIPELKENMENGAKEFSLYAGGILEDKKEVSFYSTFRKHDTEDFFYYNRINAKVSQGDELLGQASFRESWNLDPLEMFNITTYGSKVAVYKEGIKNESGELFNAWISVNEDTPLDEHGFRNLNTYHDNYYKKYPFDLDASIARLPEHILQQIEGRHDEVKQDLMQGNPVAITIDENGLGGFISINARIGRVVALDDEMEMLMFENKQQHQEKAQRQAPEAPSTETAEAEKKKQSPAVKQPMNWKNRSSKGISR